MEQFLRNLKLTVWISTLSISAILWLWSNLATIRYVDAKHDSVLSELGEIKKTVRTIDERLYYLTGRTGPRPASVNPKDE